MLALGAAVEVAVYVIKKDRNKQKRDSFGSFFYERRERLDKKRKSM